ncbi:MAG: zinc-dependent alcohol dehydrogenase family protein [Rhodospirillaceae bacterium]|nr:zinc-dependent alcohol dehydrogenase family protein [Rhodospirillaceae bacterium]
MKAVQFTEYGKPDEVCDCVEVDDIGGPADGEVIIEIMASAINPADLLMIEGRYPGPTPPAPLGIEGAGRIVEVGNGVESLQAGDHVMSLERANWAERVRVAAGRVIKVPGALSLADAAMLKANPPSAHLMLSDYVDLEPGEWVIQNAANSAVGRHVIRLAQARGLKTVNIVRREPLVSELEGLGADVVVVDGGDLAKRVRAKTGKDGAIRLGIDAVGGHATHRLADCLSDGATVVNYGYLSGEPCMLDPSHTIVRGISLTGFWLVGFMQRSTPDEIAAMYADMANKFIDGTLTVPVEAAYPITEVKTALAHAMRESRDGKVLILPNGAL